jgi:hypothetical protein
MDISRKVAVSVFGLVACAGCGPVYERVNISDRTTLATLRVSKQVYAPRAARGTLADPETGIAIEGGVSAARGRDSQLLSSGEIKIGDTTFLAPQVLENRADLAILDVSARWRHFFRQPVGYEVVLGVSHAKLDVAVSSASQSDSATFEATGLRVGAGAIWRMLPATRLEGRASVMIATYDFQEIARYELFLVQSLGKHVAARAGYGLWRGKTDVGYSSRSDIDVKLSGFSFGFDVSY